jgi:DNA helicase IV
MFARPTTTYQTTLPTILRSLNKSDKQQILDNQKKKIASIFSQTIANDVSTISLADDILHLHKYTSVNQLSLEEKVQLRLYITLMYETATHIPISIHNLVINILKQHQAIPEHF